MLVNIWATITHLSDLDFIGPATFGTCECEPETRANPADSTAPLDLELYEALSGQTHGRQIWMLRPRYCPHGTLGLLLREGYALLAGAAESYLALITPGYANARLGVPADLVERQLTQLARCARAFNKRIVTALMPVPPGAPPDLVARVGAHNDRIAAVTAAFGGECADLRSQPVSAWDEGAQLLDTRGAARLLAVAVLNSHAEPQRWLETHAHEQA